MNHRPTRIVAGVDSPLKHPGAVDFVVVREGTEGPYVGNGGRLRIGTPHEVANELSVNTAFGVERVVRYAFDQAERRRRHLTWVAKTNVLTNAGALWTRIVASVAAEHPDVAVDYQHVDAATIHMVTKPSQYDVIVTRQPLRRHPHRSGRRDQRRHRTGRLREHQPPTASSPRCSSRSTALRPDIAGRGIADPTAAIGSVALLLDHLGESAAAARVTAAIDADLASRGTAPRTTQQTGRRDPRAPLTTTKGSTKMTPQNLLAPSPVLWQTIPQRDAEVRRRALRDPHGPGIR